MSTMSKLSFSLMQQPLAMCIAMIIFSSSSITFAEQNQLVELPAITIHTFSERTENIIQQQLSKKIPKNIKNLFDDIAGVNVVDTGRNYQIGDIEIRGMGGMSGTFGTGSSRVSMELDGMDISQSFNFGHNMSYGRQYFDSADLKQVQMIKGASSEGFAGHVKFQSKEPVDYINKRINQNKIFGGQVRAGYSGDNDEYSTGLSLAYQPNSQHGSSLSYTYRKYHELNNRGGLDVDGAKRTARNPLNGLSHSVNAQYVFQPNEKHKLSVIGQYYIADYDTNYRNSLGSTTSRTGIKTTTLQSTNQQKNQREALAVNYEMFTNNAFYNHVKLHFSAQHTESKAKNNVISRNENTKTTGFSLNRNGFDVKNFTFKADFHKMLGQKITHDVDYGLKVQHSMMQLNASDANATTEVKRNYFPKDQSWQIQLKLSDQIKFDDVPWSIKPSLNIQHIQTTPEVEHAVTGTQKYRKTAFGGGLSLDYQVAQHRFNVSYNHQTRLPNYGETNGQNYGHWTGKPNPHLKPETTQGLEFNWKTQGKLSEQQTTLFYNQYKDMIDVAYKGFNTPDAEAWLYNTSGKTIGYGIEWSGRTKLDRLQLIDGLSLQGSFAYMNGKGYDGQKRSKIDPLHGSFSLNYDHPNERWGLNTQVKFSAAKKEKDLPMGMKGVKGYNIINLTGYYHITPQLQLNAGLYNLFNQQYVPWYRVRGLSRDVDYNLYSEAGRYVGVNLTYQF